MVKMRQPDGKLFSDVQRKKEVIFNAIDERNFPVGHTGHDDTADELKWTISQICNFALITPSHEDFHGLGEVPGPDGPNAAEIALNRLIKIVMEGAAVPASKLQVSPALKYAREQLTIAAAEAVSRLVDTQYLYGQMAVRLDKHMQEKLTQELQLNQFRSERFERLEADLTAALERVNTYERQHSETQSQLNAVLAGFDSARTDLTAELKGQAESLVSKLEADVETSRALLAAVGENGAQTGFQQAAATERKSARIWQFIAIVLFLAWTGAVGFNYWKTLNGIWNWADAIRMSLSSLPLVLASGFAVLQVKRAHSAEKLHRRSALEIAALTPLFAGLPKDEETILRTLILPRFFGGATAGSTEIPSHYDASTKESREDAVVAFLKKISKGQ